MRRLILAVAISAISAVILSCYSAQDTATESDSASASIISGLFADTSCKTKYPVVLVHGAFFKDQNMLGINYWWGIPDALRSKGAVVYVSNQDPFNGLAVRTQRLAMELGQQFALNPAWKKINIIAHSMGPLDSRNLIANFSIPGKGPAKNYVASLSSISGINHGSEVGDVLWKLYKGIPTAGQIAADAVNAVAGALFYDQSNPDCMLMMYNGTTDFVTNVFNPGTPNQSGILYQSWGGKINYIGVTPDMLFIGPMWLLMKSMGAGDNDALVSLNSAKWGTWRGAITTSILYSGVNHFYEIDQFLGMTPGFNAPGFYINVVKELKSKGY
jgi:triacylglycerol lipase